MNYEIITKNASGFTGTAWHIRLDEPITVFGYNDEPIGSYRDFIISATNVPISGMETFIFPATEDGKVANWGELPGSRRGTRSHKRVIGTFLRRIDGNTISCR